MALRVIALSCLVFLLSLTMATSDQCQYLVRVQTGDHDNGGTDSKISLKLFNSLSNNSYTVKNLEDSGIMPPGHDYFERGNLDFFSHSGPCISVCGITVTSDNTGNKPGWYLEGVEVTVSGRISDKISFPVNQWLALGEWPNRLCKSSAVHLHALRSRPPSKLVSIISCRIIAQLSNYCSFEGVLYCKPHYDQLLKKTGSLEKSFEGTQEKYVPCKKTVYPIEKACDTILPYFS
ncbi:hypothetical protein K1719_002490 [Acacia pycnantha]|nr:hypothetical protein K1719_002490 [Acacia pycnantha]